MAFLAFRTADIFYRHAIHRTRLQVMMEFLVNAVEFVAISAGIGKIDLGSTVTVDTPAHAQRSELPYLIHFLDRSVAGLALYLACLCMLGVAEEYVIGKVMYFGPFYGFGVLRIIMARLGIIAGITV